MYDQQSYVQHRSEIRTFLVGGSETPGRSCRRPGRGGDGGGARGKPTRRGRGAQIRLGETATAWDPGGTLLEAVGIDGGGFGEGGGAQCHRGCRRRDSASQRTEAGGDRSADQRRGPATRRSRPSRLARRDADERRDCSEP